MGSTDVVRCPQCDTPIEQGQSECPSCGASVVVDITLPAMSDDRTRYLAARAIANTGVYSEPFGQILRALQQPEPRLRRVPVVSAGAVVRALALVGMKATTVPRDSVDGDATADSGSVPPSVASQATAHVDVATDDAGHARPPPKRGAGERLRGGATLLVVALFSALGGGAAVWPWGREARQSVATSPLQNQPVAERKDTVLPPERLQPTVREASPEFARCYETGQKKNPKLTGRVSTRIVIDREGWVLGVADHGSDLPDPETQACVRAAFARLRFPADPARTPEAAVVYPVSFAPDRDNPVR